MNMFVNNLDEFKIKINKYKNCHNMLLVVVPSLGILPFVMTILNIGKFRRKRKLIIHYSGLPNNSNSKKYYLLNKNLIVFYVNTLYPLVDVCEGILKEININNIKFNTFITHNFWTGSKIIYNLLIKDHNLTSINFYADGGRNNYKAETDDQLSEDLHTTLIKNNIPNTLYFYGFIHNTYITYINNNNLKIYNSDKNNNFKILKYNESIYPKIDINLQKCQNIGLILTRYFGVGDYTFKKNVDIEQVVIDQMYKLFDNSTDNFIKFDNRITFDTSKLIENTKYKNFDNIISNLSDNLMESILLNDIDFCSNIKKIYCFDGSFPLIFQLPKLYRNLNKDIVIYIGFSKEIFNNVATKKCINILTKRTIIMIINLNKLNLFDIYLKDKLINKNETFEEIKRYEYCLFTLKLKHI